MTEAPRHDVDVSVIIPVRDGAAFIDQQLSALAVQDTDLRFEVLVVDNGSKDDTLEVVHQRQESFPVPLRIVDGSQAAGAAHARNAGAQLARGSILAFCDADDRVAETWVSGAYAGLRDVDVVGGPFRRLEQPFRSGAPLLAYGSYHRGRRGDSVSSGNMAIRRDLFMAAGGFDAGMPRYGGEDLDLCIRLSALQARFGGHVDMVVYFRQTTEVVSRAKKLASSSVAEVAIWRRHPDLFPETVGFRGALRHTAHLPRAVLQSARNRQTGRAVRIVLSGAVLLGRLIPGAADDQPPILLSETSPKPREISGR